MSLTPSAASPTPPRTIAVPPATRVRWLVLAMLFIVTTINYADRATLSIAGADMRKAFDLSPVQMGYIFSAFAWSYVLAQLPGGWLLDRFGSKTTYFFGLTLWSLFTLFQGTVGFLTGSAAVAVLFVLRLALGAAEAPSFPGNGRITSAWFPANERGLASAIFNSAQYFATALFAPIMGWIVHTFGWQAVFYVMGGLGLVLALAWNKVIYGPRAHPWVNQAEIDYIQAGGALVDLDGRETAARSAAVDTFACIKELLGNRMLLGLYVFQYCINVLTYFFLTWFPVYLVSERHMTILKAGFVASLPAICGFVGGVLGGWISDRLIKIGWSLSAARKTPIVVGMLLAMSIIACNYAKSDALVVGLGCEKLQPELLLPGLTGADAEANIVRLQDERLFGFTAMVDAIIDRADERLAALNRRHREFCPASDLVVGVQCGGSDAFSGVTANPAVGFASDLLVRAGATVMFSEVTEVRDAVHLLTPRAINEDVGRALIREMAWYDQYLAAGDTDRSANPTPGNKAGGLANVVEKALGSVIKSGTSPISQVLTPGERATTKGLIFAATPASDFICGTLQLASGMTLQVFTTGRGTPYGLAAAPVIKVATRSDLAARWPDLIDLDAGRIATGVSTVEDVGWELFRMILDVASGTRKPWSDQWGLYNALALFNPAPVT